MLKKILLFLKRTVTWGCVTFTALTALIYIISHFMKNTDYVTTPRMLGLLIFSMVVGAASAFLFTDLMNLLVRIMIHYGIILAAFILLFIAWKSYPKTDNGTVILIMLFTAAYAVIVGAVFGLRAVFNRKKKEEKDYKPKFSK